MNTQAARTKSAWQQEKQESKSEEGVSEQVRGVRARVRLVVVEWQIVHSFLKDSIFYCEEVSKKKMDLIF